MEWMRRGKELLAEHKKNPPTEDIKDLVASVFDNLSTLFVMQQVKPGAIPEREFLLHWKKPFDAENDFGQQELARAMAQEIATRCGPIPDADWKNINLIFLGKKSSGSPLEILLVHRVEKVSGNNPTSRQIYQDSGLAPAPDKINLNTIPVYSGLDPLARKNFGADLVKTTIPETPNEPVVFEMALNNPAATRDAQVANIKKSISTFRKEVAEQWGYIPPITFVYKQKDTIVLVIAVGRTNTGSSVERDMRLIQAHPLLQRIWSPETTPAPGTEK